MKTFSIVVFFFLISFLCYCILKLNDEFGFSSIEKAGLWLVIFFFIFLFWLLNKKPKRKEVT